MIKCESLSVCLKPLTNQVLTSDVCFQPNLYTANQIVTFRHGHPTGASLNTAVQSIAFELVFQHPFIYTTAVSVHLCFCVTYDVYVRIFYICMTFEKRMSAVILKTVNIFVLSSISIFMSVIKRVIAISFILSVHPSFRLYTFLPI